MMHWKSLGTEEKIEAIRSVWYPGISASKIAAHFDGASRNAVIGVFHRHAAKLNGMRLNPVGDNGGMSVAENRKQGGIRGGRVSKTRLSARKPATPDKPVVFGLVHVAGIPLMMLDGHRCKWPINDGGPFLFCGEATDGVRPYCGFHATESVGQGTAVERSAHRALTSKIAA